MKTKSIYQRLIEGKKILKGSNGYYFFLCPKCGGIIASPKRLIHNCTACAIEKTKAIDHEQYFAMIKKAFRSL